ncbi:alkene reductase [Streptomyces sp. 796.1]|uniref:alkene reductase n=1 Tax=Streptomyces sp. 796.1 TaxID=3163029 RepID=UPI0039C9E951
MRTVPSTTDDRPVTDSAGPRPPVRAVQPAASAPAAPPVLNQPLLRPAVFGDLALHNRVVMAPMTRARAANPGLEPTAMHVAYYAQRASAGLIITEGTWVSEEAIGFVHVPGIHREQQVAAWRQVTDAVHALGGCIVLQLWHTGACSHPDHHGGARPLGPSAVDPRLRSFTAEGFKETVTPRAMTAADLARTVADFGAAAERARRAGFDGVEIGGVGTMLFAQFLNPRLNHRSDAYGGDAAGRRRLLLDVVDAVAASWGTQRVGVRLSPYWHDGDRFIADEPLLSDYDALVAELSVRGLAYLHLRGPDLAPPGAPVDQTPGAPTPDPAAFARYRRRFDGPLIVNNGFDQASGNAAIAEGTADAVSYARHFVANPDLVTRFALGRALSPGDVRTFYGGGAEGYVDYAPSGWEEGREE